VSQVNPGISDQRSFEAVLSGIAQRLQAAARKCPFRTAREFEDAVRLASRESFGADAVTPTGNGQWFPDIAIGRFGIEVKFTENQNWRCVANSILESDRRADVEEVYVMYGKMGPPAAVRWRRYESAVMHVRTSHVPRFEIDMDARESLFEQVGVTYDDFRRLDMQGKMKIVRAYAKRQIKGTNRRLWWIEDDTGEARDLGPDVRLYTSLSSAEKLALRAEATIVSPRVVQSSRTHGKYDDAAMFLLTYHGVLCTQVRDLFSAGSVAMRSDRTRGGNYLARSLLDIEDQLVEAARRLPDSVIAEYWGVPPPPRVARLKEWLKRADSFASGWKPSEVLFLKRRLNDPRHR
jgi:hypothetical protein